MFCEKPSELSLQDTSQPCEPVCAQSGVLDNFSASQTCQGSPEVYLSLRVCSTQFNMSQRILKCTIYGDNHSQFHCLVTCYSCNSDKRNCSCESLSQPKCKRKAPADREAKESNDRLSYKQLDNLYVYLVRRHEKVG